jgi:predicted DNA-binding protein (MmcQ/YjbR family)
MLDKTGLRDYCLGKKGAIEDFPFGKDVRVFKVMGKMFALLPVDDPARISLKCDPIKAQALRLTYEAVEPGYHLNKQHWNTVTVDGSIPDEEIIEMIDHSYWLIVQKLKKSDRKALGTFNEDDTVN